MFLHNFYLQRAATIAQRFLNSSNKTEKMTQFLMQNYTG